MWLTDQQSGCERLVYQEREGQIDILLTPSSLPPLPEPPSPLLLAEIGAALVSFGVLFLFLGIILFFDAALLALGNVLFTSGITLLIGPQKTFYFFARKQKIRGTICFFVGMLLVFAKWTIIGMIVEAIGFLNLFGDFFPVILNFMRQLPFIGNFLNMPIVRDVLDKLAGARQSAV